MRVTALPWLRAGLALLALLLTVAWMAGVFSERIEPGIKAPVRGQAAGPVHTVVTREEAVFEVVPASIEARETSIIAARILGRIEELSVRAGDVVAAGDVLAKLESEELQAQVSRSEEGVRGASARLEEARRSRDRALALRRQGLLAQAAVDAAEADFLEAESELANRRQALRAAQTTLAYATIRSPLAGRVVERFAEPGETVAPGQKILAVFNPLSLRAEAWVREALAVALSPSMGLQVEVPSLGNTETGVVEEIVPAADPAARAFSVRVRLSETPGLLPGLYATLRVPAGSRERITVPAELVAEVGQLDAVWVAGARGAEQRFVRTGAVRNDEVEILAGLEAGDQLLEPPSGGSGVAVGPDSSGFSDPASAALDR